MYYLRLYCTFLYIKEKSINGPVKFLDDLHEIKVALSGTFTQTGKVGIQALHHLIYCILCVHELFCFHIHDLPKLSNGIGLFSNRSGTSHAHTLRFSVPFVPMVGRMGVALG